MAQERHFSGASTSASTDSSTSSTSSTSSSTRGGTTDTTATFVWLLHASRRAAAPSQSPDRRRPPGRGAGWQSRASDVASAPASEPQRLESRRQLLVAHRRADTTSRYRCGDSLGACVDRQDPGRRGPLATSHVCSSGFRRHSSSDAECFVQLRRARER